MKARVLFFVFLFSGCLVFAQIRDSVCIVTPQYDIETKKMVQTLSDKLYNAEYRDLSRKISGRLDSGFGSGVVITGKNQTRYVLTNQHVVSLADSVILEFRNTNGESEHYENCTIFAEDEQLDLALIVLPETARKHNPLTLSSKRIHDGDEVWSAGYPGLSGEPSWQFGKGNITNEAARVHDLIDPDLSVILQHSAPVDPGNSGGPLLQSIPGQNRIYTIAGINTWKAYFRQAANFAIPASTIETFLQRATSGENFSNVVLLKKSEVFTVNLSDISMDNDEELCQLRNIARLFSMNVIRENAEEDLLHALSRSPTHIKNDIIQNLVYSSLLDGIKIAIAWNLVEQMPDMDTQKQLAPIVPIKSTEPEKKILISYYSDSKEVLTVSWVYIHHNWSIRSFDVPKEENDEESTFKQSDKKKGTASLSFEKPYSFQIQGELSMRDDILFIGVNYGFFGRFFGGGASMALGLPDDGEVQGNALFNSKIYNVFGFIKAQIPIHFTSICINPFVSGRFGLSMKSSNEEDPEVKIFPIAGAELIIKRIPCIVISSGWIFDPVPDIRDYSGPLVSIGIGF